MNIENEVKELLDEGFTVTDILNACEIITNGRKNND